MSQPYAQKRAVHIVISIHTQDGDERHLKWHDHQAHHNDEERYPSRKLQPSEGKCGKSCDRNRDHHRGDRHQKAVHEGVTHAI